MNNTTKQISYFLIFLCVEGILFFHFDKPLSLYLREVDIRNPGFINIFRAYTDLGKSKWYLWPSGVALILCVVSFHYCVLSNSVRQRIKFWSRNLAFFFACISISGIATDILKPIIGRARPVLFDRQEIYGFSPYSFHATWNSMPSGHATTAFALSFALTALVPRWRGIWYAIGIVLAASRIMVNAHYLSDVIAGAFVALISVRMLQNICQTAGVKRLCSILLPDSQNISQQGL